jgi:hypothetical protein
MALLAAAGLATPAGAQSPDVQQRAFERAITLWVGVAGFGERLSSLVAEARYKGSVVAGAQLDLPLTRRVGLLAAGSVAPFSGQRTQSAISSQTEGNALVYRADAGLGWRFKPAVPVFFFGGGGVVGASKPAYPGFGGSTLEPEAAVAVGYDRAGSGRWNFRAVYASYFVFPSAPSANDWTGGGTAPEARPKSVSYDWTFQLGARRSFGRSR